MNKHLHRIEYATLLDKLSEKVIKGIGSVYSLIIHTIFFIVAFLLPKLHIMDFEQMMLGLTTVVSLEAIYLSIFIQIAVNKSQKNIEYIKEDVTDIQEDIDEIQEDIDEIQEDIEEIVDEEEEENADLMPAGATMTTSLYASPNELRVKIAELQKHIDELKKLV